MTQLDPRIGFLNSGKFYCFPHGYDQPEFTGSLDEVQAVLGVTRRVASNESLPQKLRRYSVTITPKILVYSGSWCGGEYQIDIWATSNTDAISKARRLRREEEGWQAVSASYRARLAK